MYFSGYAIPMHGSANIFALKTQRVRRRCCQRWFSLIPHSMRCTTFLFNHRHSTNCELRIIVRAECSVSPAHDTSTALCFFCIMNEQKSLFRIRNCLSRLKFSFRRNYYRSLKAPAMSILGAIILKDQHQLVNFLEFRVGDKNLSKFFGNISRPTQIFRQFFKATNFTLILKILIHPTNRHPP